MTMSDIAVTASLLATNTGVQNRDVLSSAIKESIGGQVTISPGVYQINPLTISTPGTHLCFEPGAVFQVVPGTKYHPSLINIAASDVTIEGGEFDGNGVVGAYGIMAIRITGGSSNITIRNCVVRNTSVGIGAYNVVNCSNWLIEGCTIDTTVSSHGIFLHGNPGENHSTYGVRIMNNMIRGARGNGVWIGNKFNDVFVVANQIFDVGRMGIEVWTNPTGRFVIAGNIIKESKSFGISIAKTPHTICADNIIHKATSYGIEIGASQFVSLSNNQIDSVQSQEKGIKPTGIALNAPSKSQVSDIDIQGGVISNCVSAINLCGDLGKRNNISVTGVVIRDCTYGIRGVGAIGQNDGGGPVEDFSISGCSINVSKVGIGNSLYGGLLRGGVISANNIRVSEGHGIDLFRPAELLIVGNRIRGENAEGSTGIRLYDHTGGATRGHDIVIRDNQIVSFEKDVVIDPTLIKTTTLE